MSPGLLRSRPDHGPGHTWDPSCDAAMPSELLAPGRHWRGYVLVRLTVLPAGLLSPFFFFSSSLHPLRPMAGQLLGEQISPFTHNTANIRPTNQRGGNGRLIVESLYDYAALNSETFHFQYFTYNTLHVPFAMPKVMYAPSAAHRLPQAASRTPALPRRRGHGCC